MFCPENDLDLPKQNKNLPTSVSCRTRVFFLINKKAEKVAVEKWVKLAERKRLYSER